MRTKILFAILLMTTASAQAAIVTGVTPPSQTIQAHEHSSIVIDFDAPVNPWSVDSQTIRVYARMGGPVSGVFQALAGNQQVRFTPHESMFAGDLVTVVVTTGVEDTLGQPIDRGYAWNYWIRTRPAAMDLTLTGTLGMRENGEGHIQCYGAHASDLNRDGWIDLSVVNEITTDVRVLLHDGISGYSGFTIYPLTEGDTPSANEGSDFNHDGFVDIAIGNTQNDQLSVLYGNGNGGFSSQESYTIGQGIRGVTVADLDLDGFDDVVAAHRTADNVTVLPNDGTGNFGAQSNFDTLGDQETACVVGDANLDGYLDVFVSTHVNSRMYLYLGDGNGGLTLSDDVPVGGRSWMLASGDVDGDGLCDVVSANSWNHNVSVIRSLGNGQLADPVVYASGLFPLAIDLGDIDGDGDLDLVCSNFTSVEWNVFENEGDGTFALYDTLPASGAGSCAVLFDRDRDGDLDMTGVDEIDDLMFWFENQAAPAAVDEIPSPAVLHGNSPNPFNPYTTFDVELEFETEVTVEILTVRGERVRLVASERRGPGRWTFSWDGRNDLGENVPSGTYVYRVLTPAASQSRKMTLVR